MLDYNYARIAFNRFVVDTKKRLPNNLSVEEVNKRLKMFDYVTNYTNTCIGAGELIMGELNASDSIKEFSKIVILNHDIGRFEQIRLYGSLDDSILESESVVSNHGQLGDILLTELVKIEVPDSYAQMPIRRIVRNHVSKEIDESSLGILSNSDVIKGDIEKILVGNQEQARFIDAMTLFVRDIENLELYPRFFDDNNGREEFKLSNSFNIRYNEALGKIKRLGINSLL